MAELDTLLGWNQKQRDKGSWYVLDPDGFDRTDPLMNDRLYTFEEYERRAMLSTVMMPYSEHFSDSAKKEFNV